MSPSNEEKILRELQLVNAQLNPGKAFLKALLLLVLCAIVFTAVALIVNSMTSRHDAVHVRPVSKGGHSRPSHASQQPQIIKESFQ